MAQDREVVLIESAISARMMDLRFAIMNSRTTEDRLEALRLLETEIAKLISLCDSLLGAGAFRPE